ncbi:group II intron reverse transcriptase/maturase [Tolumonas lignilytica]|uniref:group II intron reverse transcriptase/maturase n=1 Tax=Tolumonas lignilytica TaxID=1283284 RepID=UPI0004672340|nr:group II intron reverse transcriptase/maturase [Tolumonas lignilytica]
MSAVKPAAQAATLAVPASSHPTDWHSINWRQVHRQVRGLQVRIAEATKHQQWRRVKQLQRLLVRSFAARALAVKRVTENRGKRTAGVDGEIWSTPNCKWQAIGRLTRTGYHPRPLRRVYIPKSNGKRRPLGIPTMTDRAMQALYLLALEPVAETTGDPNSYGFRPHRSTADAIAQCFTVLAKSDRAQWVLEGDIKGFFDNISHEWIIKHVPLDRQVIRKWLKSGYMEKGRLFDTNAGTPQGGIISPVIANMVLDGLENKLLTLAKNQYQQRKLQLNYVRYADDFIVTGCSKELLETIVKPCIESFLKIRGVELSAEKTLITHIDDGFDFLGQNVRKYNGKLLIKPSKKNVLTFLNKVREVLRCNKMAPAWLIVQHLNPKIRGWTNYHRHVVSSEVFSYIDHQIWQMLWRWSKRRHHNKSRCWIAEKYFGSRDNRSWVFCGENPEEGMNYLVQANETVIKRHVKVKSGANPYDQEYEHYFELRQQQRFKENRLWFYKLRLIGERQGHRCPLCGQPFRDDEEWDLHHLIYQIRGGGDEAENLIMLHPNCHRQYHAKMDGNKADTDLESVFMKA